MLGAREAREIATKFCQQRLGHGGSDPGDRIQSPDSVLVGSHTRGDLGTDPGNRRIQKVDVGQLLGYQEALVWSNTSDQRPLKLGEFLAQSSLRQLRERGYDSVSARAFTSGARKAWLLGGAAVTVSRLSIGQPTWQDAPPLGETEFLVDGVTA